MEEQVQEKQQHAITVPNATNNYIHNKRARLQKEKQLERQCSNVHGRLPAVVKDRKTKENESACMRARIFLPKLFLMIFLLMNPESIPIIFYQSSMNALSVYNVVRQFLVISFCLVSKTQILVKYLRSAPKYFLL